MITIVGSNGYLGSNLVSFFKEQELKVLELNRGFSLQNTQDYGVVIYCAGLTHDAQTNPLDSTKAHICDLIPFLKHKKVQKVIYCSSTRIYQNAPNGCEDISLLTVNQNDVYNISKLAGEIACLGSEKKNIVVRLSNITSYNPNSTHFLWSILRQIKAKEISYFENEDAARDYICLSDVLKILAIMVHNPVDGILNVCSGVMFTNKELSSLLKEFLPDIKYSYGNQNTNMPPIRNDNLLDLYRSDICHPKVFIKKLIKRYIDETH